MPGIPACIRNGGELMLCVVVIVVGMIVVVVVVVVGMMLCEWLDDAMCGGNSGGV